jgi:hypothetical protein
MASAIQILKKSRKVEFREGITKAELVTIILKMTPKVVGDEDPSPYQFTGFDPNNLSSEEIEGEHGIFGDILNQINSFGAE